MEEPRIEGMAGGGMDGLLMPGRGRRMDMNAGNLAGRRCNGIICVLVSAVLGRQDVAASDGKTKRSEECDELLE